MDIPSMLIRELKLPKTMSFFLFGARQVGKTSLVKTLFDPKTTKYYNLFVTQDYARLVANPGILREDLDNVGPEITHVFIDEAQRIPELLNEVQYLLDNKTPLHFILSGSSARKLRRGKANLLAGRAWAYNLYPLTLHELPSHYTLNNILAFGTLPPNIVAVDDFTRTENLRAYVDVYLREEIEMEALSRNIGGFIRFLSIAAQCNGEQINFSNIARDVGLSDMTVKEYFKILEDTLLGTFLMPFTHSERKKHKLSPKFYFFDTGVLRATQKKLTLQLEPQTFEFGSYFETWIINEVRRISEYLRKDLDMSFLRTANDVETDLVITFPDGRVWAIEIKSKKDPIPKDFASGFEAILKLAPKARCICVCNGERARKVEGYDVVPYAEFLHELRSA